MRTRFCNGDIGKYIAIRISPTVIPIRAEYPTFRERFLLRRLKSIHAVDLPGNIQCVHIYIYIYIYIYRSQWPRGLRNRSAAARLLRVWDRIPRGHRCLSVVSVVCCQVEVPASGRSLVQRSPTD
jgi:hypothetical protein